METLVAGILALVGLAEIYLLIYLVALPPKARKRPDAVRLERLNVFLAMFFVMTLGAFGLMNGEAYAENISFGIRSAFGIEDPVPTEPIFNLPSTAARNAADGASGSLDGVPVPAPGSPMELVIPKLDVKVPVVFPSDTSTQGVLKSLESGVGVYPGSIMPGQEGHMIILGHSSRASWYRGEYARVFALLKILEEGDEFMIIASGKKYVYKVTSNQVFKPAATDAYLTKPVQGSVVDLVTCDPVGSAANRRVVSATLQT